MAPDPAAYRRKAAAGAAPVNNFARRGTGGSGNENNSYAYPYWRRRNLPTPKLPWRHDWDSDECKGRVLLIDYMKYDYIRRKGPNRVSAIEIDSLSRLEKYYGQAQSDDCILRIVHVQNAPWAEHYLMKKFNIQSDSTNGTDFAKWLTRPRFGPKKPTSKAWKAQHDPWRGISRCMLGMDYLKAFPREDADRKLEETAIKGGSDGARAAAEKRGRERPIQLNAYNSNNEPSPTYDIYNQRLSVYVQHKHKDQDIVKPEINDIQNPYERRGSLHAGLYVPEPHKLDNGNTVIIFEESQSNSVHDVLIPAQKDYEAKWRRLPFYYSYENSGLEESDNDTLAIDCIKLVIEDVNQGLIENWESLLELTEDHIGILEEKLYKNPEDDGRAREVFDDSFSWLKFEKLLAAQQDSIMQFSSGYLVDLLSMGSDYSDTSPFLPQAELEWQRISNFIQEGLVKPTASLSDLLYKSSALENARFNLELSSSVWRLTNVATLFLPLTYVSSLFGMNIEALNGNGKTLPGAKWYVIVTIPFLVAVYIALWAAKHVVRDEVRTFTTKSVYTSLYSDLTALYPTLWSPTGPRDFLRPRSAKSRIKWALIHWWANPKETVFAGETSGPDKNSGLGTISKWKRSAMREWSRTISFEMQNAPLNVRDEEQAVGSTLKAGIKSANEAIASTTATTGGSTSSGDGAAGEHTIVGGEQGRLHPHDSLPVERRPSSSHSQLSEKGSDGRSSAWMTEEGGPDWHKEPDMFERTVRWAGLGGWMGDGLERQRGRRREQAELGPDRQASEGAKDGEHDVPVSKAVDESSKFEKA